MLPEIGQQRVIIEGVSPEIDAGRYPIKRVIGEPVIVEADIFCGWARCADMHVALSAQWRQNVANNGDGTAWQ